MTYGVVYSLHDPDTDEVRYVGQTTQADWRRYCEGHLPAAVRTARPTRHVEHWLRTLDRQPTIRLVEGHPPILTKQDLDCVENDAIKILWKLGYRLTNARGGGSGGKHSPEARANMSAAYVRRMEDPAERRRMAEVMADPARRAKISATLRRRFADPEERTKQSEVTRRAMADPDVRAKISAAARGRVPWNKGRSGVSPETSRRLSAANVRRYEDPAERAKTGATSLGRKHSPEHRARISAAASEGRKRGIRERREAADES